MSKEDFENQLRGFLRRKPFFPFRVVLLNGEEIEVDISNSVAFNGGAAIYASATGDATFFACEEVDRIVAATQGAAS